MKYFIALLVLVLVLAHGVFSATIHVPADRSTISAGISAASNGDTVLVSPGVYQENISFGGKRIVLQSVAGYATTTIKAVTGDQPVVDFSHGEDQTTVLSGFTIDGNNLAPGIQCRQTSPIIQYCQIQNCSTTHDGGGAYLYRSGATVRYSLFHDNYAPATGGGICVAEGIGAGYGTCLIYGNEFYHHNTGTAQALGCLGAYSLHIHHNVFHDNLNPGSWSSGGVYLNGGNESVIIYNNTFVRNTHGLVSYDSAYTAAYFENNIVVGSTYKGISSWTNNASYNDVWGNGVIDSFPGFGTISVDPMFVNPASDFHLNVASPCIDVGSPTLGLNDSDGTRLDLGAFMSLAHTPYVSNISLGPGFPGEINTARPPISWNTTTRVGTQVAYEIQISNNSDFSGTLLWESGEVTSAATSVLYTGPDLTRGVPLWLRIRIADPNGWGGWNTCQFFIRGFPSIPVALSPVGLVTSPNVSLTAQNSTHPEGRPLSYDFEVSTDSGFSTVVATRSVVGQAGVTSTDTIYNLIAGQTYYWHVRASDGINKSDYSPAAIFTTPTDPRSLVRVPLDYPTIQAAIDIHRTGDTILVAPGTYVGAVNFRGRGILLRSDSGAAATILRTQPGYGTIVIFTAHEDTNSVLDGFTIDGATVYHGITCEGSAPVIQNCEIMNCRSGSDGGGIYCYAAAPKIRFNKIHDNIGYGTGSGLAIDASMPGRTGEITHNWFYSHKQGSAHAVGCSYAGNFLIRYNVFTDNKNDAVWTAAGIYMNEGGSNIDISNNTFVGNSRAMVLNGLPQPRFYNNIVTDCSLEPLSQRLAAFDYNDFWHNAGWNTPGPYGIVADPQFVDAPAGDFRLKSTSPCLNHGNPDPLYDDPDNSRSDIGAFYRMSSAPASFALLSPGDTSGYYLYTLAPTFTWLPSTDVDSGDVITYEIELGYGTEYGSTAYRYSTSATSLVLPVALTHQVQYWWRVTATDLQGHSTPCVATKSFETWVVGDFNHSHSINLADLSLLIAFLGGEAQLTPKVLGDVTGDCLTNLSDLSRLTAFLSGQSVSLLGSNCGAVSATPAEVKLEAAAKPADSHTKPQLSGN
jgi:hypothetical protein